jgi:hypothetical protein
MKKTAILPGALPAFSAAVRAIPLALAVLSLTVLSLTGCEQPAGVAPLKSEEEPRAVLMGISVDTSDAIVIYGLGQSLDREHIAVMGQFSDGTERRLAASEYEMDEPDTSREMVLSVQVRAGGFSASFWIEVNRKALQSIELASPPSRTVYELGQGISRTGMAVTGVFSDGSRETLAGNLCSLVGYDPLKRGQQTVTVKINGKSVTFTATMRIPANAEVYLNTRSSFAGEGNNYKQAFIRGEPMTAEALNLRARIVANGAETRIGMADGGITLSDITGYSPNTAGDQTLTLRLDDAVKTFPVRVLDVEPAVWFDYGYMRTAADLNGHGQNEGTGASLGADRYYARPGETLYLVPVRYLVGYNRAHQDTGASYSWSVSGGSYTGGPVNSPAPNAVNPPAPGECYAFTPAQTGTYTVTVNVTGTNYITQETITKTASAQVLCYNPGDAGIPQGTFLSSGSAGLASRPVLRNYSPGQFTQGGTGLGWSLGAVGGYLVWQVEDHRAEYFIDGNPMEHWSEAGVVWVQEDNNGNGLPDETWYELYGSDDFNSWKSQITRRFAITYVKCPDSTENVNTFAQTVRDVYWADAKGRAGMMRAGWPVSWGVPGDRVTYTGTLLRDDPARNPWSARYPLDGFDYGYADTYCRQQGRYGKFRVTDARRADGSPVTLTNVRFIKVQTGIFMYGGSVGDVSTEVYSADFLGGLTNFPKPEDSAPM